MMSTLLHREWIEPTLYRVEVWERFQIFIAEFYATGSTLWSMLSRPRTDPMSGDKKDSRILNRFPLLHRVNFDRYNRRQKSLPEVWLSP